LPSDAGTSAKSHDVVFGFVKVAAPSRPFGVRILTDRRLRISNRLRVNVRRPRDRGKDPRGRTCCPGPTDSQSRRTIFRHQRSRPEEPLTWPSNPERRGAIDHEGLTDLRGALSPPSQEAPNAPPAMVASGSWGLVATWIGIRDCGRLIDVLLCEQSRKSSITSTSCARELSRGPQRRLQRPFWRQFEVIPVSGSRDRRRGGSVQSRRTSLGTGERRRDTPPAGTTGRAPCSAGVLARARLPRRCRYLRPSV